MGRIGLAFRLFFKVLGDPALADQSQRLLDGKTLPAPTPVPTPTPAPQPVRRDPARSDALTLLSVLQRETRLIDFLKEDLTSYADAQIGAAVRDVHRDASALLERLFALRPLRTEPEGSPIDVAPGFDPHQLRLTGNVSGSPPYRGPLRHPGWQATKQDLPEWSGPPTSPRVVAPAEVEVP